MDVLCCLVAISPPTTLDDLPGELSVKLSAANTFHHSEVFKIVMCLKKGISSKKFDEYAPNAPEITWVAPTKIQDDLGCSIVPRGDD